MVNDIVASGPVIIEEGKLLVSKDTKDDFYKIPGGQPRNGEGLKDCVLRRLKEETGFSGTIGSQLSTYHLDKRPGTDEEVKMHLYHFGFKLANRPKDYGSFAHGDYKVSWLDIEEIKQDKHNVAPNIKFLIERGDIQ